MFKIAKQQKKKKVLFSKNIEVVNSTVWPYLLLGVFPRRLRSAVNPVFSLEGVAQRSSAFPMRDSSSPACRVKL